MNINWTNSGVSGLCDRLIDIVLVSALAKYYDGELYFNWKVFQNGGRHSWSYSDSEKRWWDEIRFQDYLYENFSEYFTLPDWVKVNQTPNDNFINYDQYLGGCYSPKKFSKIYSIDNYEKFIECYKFTLSQIKPTKKLLQIVNNLEIPDVTVHLRRCDKIRSDGDGWSINPNQLDELNQETFQLIEKLKSKDYSVYICSDDDNEKRMYQNKFNTINKNIELNHIYEKTYIDLYMMSKSKYVVMSQVHSNFSLFGAIVGNSELIELYEDKDRQTFNDIIDITYYKNI